VLHWFQPFGESACRDIVSDTTLPHGSLADSPELVGFFSYSREDDDDSRGALSALRDAIQRELRGQLGRSRQQLRLWQDKEAIAPGRLWESEIKAAVEQSVFFHSDRHADRGQEPVLPDRIRSVSRTRTRAVGRLGGDRSLAQQPLRPPACGATAGGRKMTVVWRWSRT
jgi:hypothetical protein